MQTAIPEAEYERDRQLVLRCQHGDEDAFGELYQLHYERLRRWCHQRMTDAYAAEEVAQDAFVRAFLALETLGGERHFFAWLTVISRRLMIDRYRRNRRVRVGTAELGPGDRAAEEIALARLDGEQLRVALNRVRPRYRDVLRLREWEGLSYEAIAERLGVTRATVPPLLHRARIALRREYLALGQTKLHGLVAPVLSAVFAPLRRLRDRVLQGLAQLPDPSGLSAPMAAIALGLGLGAVAGSMAGGFGAAVPPLLPDDDLPVLQAAVGGLPELSFTNPTETGGHGSPAPLRDERGTKVLNGVVFLAADQESAEAQRQHTREHMPYYYEVGDSSVAANPDAARRDLLGTSEGDLRWVDGRGNDDTCRPAPGRPCTPDASDWELVSEH